MSKIANQAAQEQAAAKNRRDTERKALFPGREIKVTVGDVPLTFVIAPVGFKHIKRYGAFIATAITNLASMSVTKSEVEGGGNIEAAIVAHLVPAVMANGMNLLEECVSIPGHAIKVEDLPYEFLPPLIEAWLEESFFGERKWSPWISMIEKLILKSTGTALNLSGKISSFFSSTDIQDKISSITDNPDFLTKDGPSLSSGIGSTKLEDKPTKTAPTI